MQIFLPPEVRVPEAYILKSSAGEVLRDAISATLAGGTYFPSMPVQLQVEEKLQQLPILTPRQIEVLTYLAAGLPNKEIALALGLSCNTINVHVTAILKALKTNNRTEAAYAATRLGLVPDSTGLR